MAQHYDLEQQEQLAALKAFWDKWGTLITGLALALVLALAGWNGWKSWQSRKAAQASVLLEQVNLAVQQNNRDAVLQNLTVLRGDYGKTAQAGQGGLLAARFFAARKDWAAAEETLDWVSGNASDAGFRALAVLHKSAALIEQGKLDAALAVLQGHAFPFEYRPLGDDRRGDILNLQGKAAEAIDAYNQAFEGFDEFSSYRPLVEIKLNALGQEPRALRTGSAPAA